MVEVVHLTLFLISVSSPPPPILKLMVKDGGTSLIPIHQQTPALLHRQVPHGPCTDPHTQRQRHRRQRGHQRQQEIGDTRGDGAAAMHLAAPEPDVAAKHQQYRRDAKEEGNKDYALHGGEDVVVCRVGGGNVHGSHYWGD